MTARADADADDKEDRELAASMSVPASYLVLVLGKREPPNALARLDGFHQMPWTASIKCLGRPPSNALDGLHQFLAAIPTLA